jgi:hypothetical protein
MGGFMQFDLNFERNEVYECGATLLAAMVSARAVDDEKSFELFCSLCGKALWLRHLENPDHWTPIRVKPQYVFRDRKIIDSDVAYVAKRLGERMVAGRMAIAFFQQAELGQLKPLPKGIQRLSVNQMAEFVLDDAEQADASNVEQRIWAPSRPVVHLAAATAIKGQEARRSGHELALETLLADRALIESIVKLAEELEALVAKDPRFPVKADQLLRFRLS